MAFKGGIGGNMAGASHQVEALHHHEIVRIDPNPRREVQRRLCLGGRAREKLLACLKVKISTSRVPSLKLRPEPRQAQLATVAARRCDWPRSRS